MYPVTREYSTQMRLPVREAIAHAEVFLGVFDRTAYIGASAEFPSAVFYSDPGNVIGSNEKKTGYATFETDGFRLDGEPLLIPSAGMEYKPQGYVSQELSGEDGSFQTPQIITVNLTGYHDMIGITLAFDPLFPSPTSVRITGYTDETAGAPVEISSPIPATLRSRTPFEQVNRFVIEILSGEPFSRARLNEIEFGIGYTYSDTDIVRISERHQGSPVSLSLPVSSLEVSLFNENAVFNVDSNSELHTFFAEGQPVSVDYSIDLPSGSVQRIPGGIWQLKGWSVDAFEAKLKMENVLTTIEKTSFYKGVYDGTKRTLAQLAETVFQDAGISEGGYFLDPYLYEIETSAPIPIVSHAEALQLIANAGLSKLFVDRNGRICIEAIVEGTPTPTTTTPQTFYGDVNTVLGAGNVRYMTFERNFAALDGTMVLLPDDETALLPAGYVGDSLSEGTHYPENELLLTWLAPTNVFTLTVIWGGSIPHSVDITPLVNGEWGEAYTIYPAEEMESYSVSFRHCTQLKVVLGESKTDGVRPRILRIAANQLSNFVLDDPQIFEGATGSMEIKLKDVLTYWISRTTGTEPVEIARQSGWTNGEVIELQHGLALDYTVLVEKDGEPVEGISVSAEHYAYVSYITLTGADQQEVDVVLSGRMISEQEVPITSTSAQTGENLEIVNPLFDAAGIAQNTADWVRNYYAKRIVYDDNIRGFPELEYGDYIYLSDGSSAVITNLELQYTGAFSGKIRLRR